jgi:hypothetical protein
VGLVLIVVVVLYRGLLNLWIGGSPQYRTCAAAMRQVVVDMPWSEAERHIAVAVKVGGERWEPGPDVLADPMAAFQGFIPGMVQVNCWHYGYGRVGQLRIWLAAVERRSDYVPFCTTFDLWQLHDRVGAVSSENCPVPTDLGGR